MNPTATKIVRHVLIFGIVAFVVVPLAIPGLIFLATQQGRK